ncbi:mitochondrial-processing peptidase subunit beta [Rozella allomycis CSF55]|uniref:mitochondrial processing peptidase n=1 Tax=Rozella allomycis (strain CSF55) TaxID=988480 RepID=A0A075B2S6_ROZAC|nr:Peptidase M16, zinc-binding site domain-containing protein [Rozella allomycis CSF55]RKP20639.1 mitochondrial-processing peptidase subunit beta [Rozella allomycis CSF55]|eukprot:EPZ35276.1 Peptidase M16, zinc-binding site domain-containing protein [Rozella allomycis CSF55]
MLRLLNRFTQSRPSISSFLRSYSNNLVRTQVTTLPNGMRVASENLETETATVGVWIDAGSRYEDASNNGTAHFLEHMAFKGTAKRSQRDLEIEIENMGGHLNAYTSREQTVYYAKVFKKDIPQAVDILSDILQNAKYEEEAIEQERKVILREYEEVSQQFDETVFDHLHGVAYQGTPLGQTILGPVKNIKRINRKDLTNFVDQNYVGSRMVVAAAGGVDHGQLVKLTEAAFSKIKKTSPKGPQILNPVHFTGSEVRLKDDTMDIAHMVLAVEGVSWTSPDYYKMLVAQAALGSWDRSMAGGVHLSSKFAQLVSEFDLAQSYTSFNTSYKDTGLFGVYMVSDRVYGLDDLFFDLQQAFNHMCLKISPEEVERAKVFLKSNFLLQLDGTTAVCEDIGRQMLCYGKRYHLNEIFQQIDAVNAKNFKETFTNYVYDRSPAVVGFGPVATMPDYSRIRSHMLWLRN